MSAGGTPPRRRKAHAAKDDVPESVRELIERLEVDASIVELHRRRGANQYDYVAEIAPADFSYENVRELYGMGSYQIRIFKTGTAKPIGTKSFGIAAEGPAAPVGVPGQDSTTRELLGMIKDLSARMERFATAPVAPPAGEAMNQGIQIAGLLQAANADTNKLLLALVTQKSETKAGPAAEYVALLREGMKLGRDSQPEVHDSDGGAGWAGIIERLAPQVMEGLAAAKANAPPALPPEAPPGTPRPPAVEVPATAVPWAQAMAPWVGEVLDLAVRRRDPATYARLIFDDVGTQAPAYRDGELRELLDPSRKVPFIEDFVLQFPAAAPHRDWLERLIEALRALLFPAAAPAPEAPGPPE